MHEIDIANLRNVMLAGNATITLKIDKAERHYTYRIKQCKDKSELYFIYLLKGPDNETDYTYFGCYYSDTNYYHPCKRYIDVPNRNRPTSLQRIRQLLISNENIKGLKAYHEGKCCKCGRKLTTPESILKGIGPECERLLA
jgi:hypothetical protein